MTKVGRTPEHTIRPPEVCNKGHEVSWFGWFKSAGTFLLLAASPSPATAAASPSEGLHQVSRSLLRVAGRKGVALEHSRSKPPAVPEAELVLARDRQPLHWLNDVPAAWNITVYDRHPDDPVTWPREVSRVPVPNYTFGKDARVFAHHITHRYTTLAGYTAFAGGDALDFNPRYIDLLNAQSSLEPLQAMSLMRNEEVPPRDLLQAFHTTAMCRPEVISLYTLDSVWFRDEEVEQQLADYQKYYNLSPGTNVVAHYFSTVGLPHWLSATQEIGPSAYGGMFGVRKDNLLLHPASFYSGLDTHLRAFDGHAFVMDRAWLMLLTKPATEVESRTS